MARWGNSLRQFINEKRLLLRHDNFWNMPIPFSDMPDSIYTLLEESDLIILKGDVNYRRLVDDRHWPHNTSMENFSQYVRTNCLLLRVLKSEVLVGFDSEKHSNGELSVNWMTEGKFGVIQYVQSK